jgi:hypothetical protein
VDLLPLQPDHVGEEALGQAVAAHDGPASSPSTSTRATTSSGLRSPTASTT